MSNSIDTRLKPNYRNFDRNGRRKKISESYILGYFSINQNREFIPDHSNCKYLKLPARNEPIHFDLNEGYETVQHKPKLHEKENLNHILKFILLNLKKLIAPPNTNPELMERFLNFDIISFRGKLRMLMCTPYSFRDGWSLIATKWMGNIYLCEYQTVQERMKVETQTEESKKICSYGFKFEQFVMSDSPTTEPVTNTPVLEGEEFCCMFTTKLEQTSILFGAEMDGIEGCSTDVDFTKTNPNDLKFAELKVRIQPSNQRQEDNFHRFKTINWWCQSYLVKVQKIIVGMRTQAGIVDKLVYLNVDSMPRMNERYWSDTICIDFFNHFLTMVKELLNDVDCPHTVYRFKYDPCTSSSIQCDILEGSNECSLIPSWYINEVQKFKSK